MNAYSLLEARGYLLVSADENFEIFSNRFRGYKLTVSLKEQWYRLEDYLTGGAVIITPKMHHTLTQYLNFKNFENYATFRHKREQLGITVKEVAQDCRVSSKTIINHESGIGVSKDEVKKIYSYYIERGIIL